MIQAPDSSRCISKHSATYQSKQSGLHHDNMKPNYAGQACFIVKRFAGFFSYSNKIPVKPQMKSGIKNNIV